MPANFNTIAWCYDRLSGAVFGRTIRQSQIDQLPFIPAGATVLIVGGGTGWILEEIAKIHASGLKIIYIDSSSKMIDLAARRHIAGNKIEFITAPIEDLFLTGEFDVIITPFLFDMFLQAACSILIEKLKNSLKENGFWFYSDFCLIEENKWQKILLRLMYCFFRIICKIDSKELPVVSGYFCIYKIIRDKTYCRGFICSRVFKNSLQSQST